MISLVQAIIKFMQQPSNKMLPFIGSYTFGNSTSKGPFLGVAPQGTSFPYVVYDILPNPLDQGFGGVMATYGENPVIRWNLYDDDIDNLCDSLTLFTNKMDTLIETDFTLDDGQTCPSCYREENPQMIHEPVGKDGKRVYHAMVSYTYHNARYKGDGQ